MGSGTSWGRSDMLRWTDRQMAEYWEAGPGGCTRKFSGYSSLPTPRGAWASLPWFTCVVGPECILKKNKQGHGVRWGRLSGQQGAGVCWGWGQCLAAAGIQAQPQARAQQATAAPSRCSVPAHSPCCWMTPGPRRPPHNCTSPQCTPAPGCPCVSPPASHCWHGGCAAAATVPALGPGTLQECVRGGP